MKLSKDFQINFENGRQVEEIFRQKKFLGLHDIEKQFCMKRLNFENSCKQEKMRCLRICFAPEIDFSQSLLLIRSSCNVHLYQIVHNNEL